MGVIIVLDEFISKYEGKKIGYDGYVGECLSLVKQYIKELYGIEPPPSGVGAAFGYWTNFPDPLGEVFEKITTNPKPGDIVVWGTGLGAYGHIAIYLTGDENNFTSFDQNFPIGSPCHKQNHNYKSVLGYLCPKGNQMDLEQVKELLFTVLEPEWQEWNNRKVKISEPTMRAEIADRLSRWSPTNKWVFADLPIKWRETRQKTIEKCPVCQPPVVSPALPVKDCTSGIAGAVKAEQNRIFNNLVK